MKNRNFITSALVAVTLLLSACGGGGSSSDNSQKSSSVVSGTAQLGYIKDANVNLYELSNLNKPIATTNTSSSINTSDAGSFTFDTISLDDNKYYLVRVSNGKDIDANDDGVVDHTYTDLNGSVYTLAKGSDLKSGDVRVNALADIAYQKLKGNLNSLSTSQIDTKLVAVAKEYLYDIDGDDIVSNTDILKFDPTKHINKTRKSYRDILDIYVPKLHNGESDNKKLASLMYLDNPRIVIKNGALQEVPFTLDVSIENKPQNTTVKWYLNSVEKISINEQITDDSIYSILAKIYKDDTLLKTISSQVIATKQVEIASIDVDITKDNIVFVTDESNSSLAGTKIIVPKGALKENIKITIKKSSINTIPNTDGISISDVIVMEPSGLKFDKPVQIRIPYDEGIDIENQYIRIARYSDGGKIDYIEPLFIDKENHEVVFETEHFTKFGIMESILKFKYYKTEDKNFINALNQEFPNYGYDIDEWKPILNVYIDKEFKKLTVYDYLKVYLENKRIYNIIEKKAILTDNGTLDYSKSYNYPYIKALKTIYPNSAEYSKTYQMWDDVKTGFIAIELIQNIGGSVINIAKGEVFTDLINTLGIPTSTADLSFYSPTDVGTGIIKVVVDLENNNYIRDLSNYASFENGRFKYNDEISDGVKSFLDNNGIRWIAEDIIRRYKGFKSWDDYNNINQYEHSKQVIDSAIAYIKAKGNTLDIHSYTIKLDKEKPLVNETITYDIKFEVETSLNDFESSIGIIEVGSDGFQRDRFGFSVGNISNKNIKIINNKHYKISFDSGTKAKKRYFKLFYYVKSTEYGKVDDRSYYIGFEVIKAKQQIKITNSKVNYIKAKSNENRYYAKVDVGFDKQDISYTIEARIQGELVSKDKYLDIPSKYFDDSSLSNLAITITPEKNYKYITQIETISANIKQDIDKLKAKEEIITSEPELKIIQINGISVSNEAQSIYIGDTVTYSIKRDTFQKVLSKSALRGSCTKNIDDTYEKYTCTYNNTRTIFPKVKVQEKGTYKSRYIKAPKVTVKKDDSEPLKIIINKDERVYTIEDKTINFSIDINDDSRVDTYKWESYQNNIHIKNSKLKNAFIIIPKIDDAKIHERIFKITVTGYDNIQVTKEYVVKIQGTGTKKKQITYIKNEETYPDDCESYNDNDCSYLITSNKHLFRKVWTFKNGESTLHNLYALLDNDNRGDMNIGQITIDKTTIKPNEEFKVITNINIPDYVIDGVYKVKWYLKDNTGIDIKFPPTAGKVATEAHMWFNFKVNRGNSNENNDLKDLVVGKTFYNKCGSYVDTLVFQINGKFKIIEEKETIYEDYSISGDTIISVSNDNEEKTHVFKDVSTKYIRFDEEDGEVTTLYFNRSDALNSPNNDCGKNDNRHDPEGYTYYDNNSYKILRARSYQSSLDNSPVQIYLKTHNHGGLNKNGGLQFTIDKYSTNQKLKSALENNSKILLSRNDLKEYGLQYWKDNQPTGVSLEGTLKLIWLNNENRFSIEQNGATLIVDNKRLTFSKTIVQWTSENH